MYLTCVLLDNGCKVLPKTKQKGPDVEIESIEFNRIWVEAIAATAGDGNDRVPTPKHDDPMWFCVPEEKIVLRYAAAINEKHQKYIRYREDEVIGRTEPYIIAVNGNKIPYASDSDDEIPYIVQAVLPFGLPTIQIEWDSQKEPTSGYAYRNEIIKNSGNNVATNIFQKKEHEGISGVISSRVSVHGLYGKMGTDFVFVHNPLALNKLPEGWLRFGREYRFSENGLEGRRWS